MTSHDDSGIHATLADLEDTPELNELPRGSNLGRYVIIEPIGSGGMGTVYRAYDPQLNRGVALKILSVKQTDAETAEKAKARLIREAQALAQLSHPNVVAVHDAGTFEDDVFIAMELVEGKTLHDWLEEDKRTVKEVLEVLKAAGRGLSAAHKAGLVHRDFKPGNVIVGDDGRVRVLDFGLARVADQQGLLEKDSLDSEHSAEAEAKRSQEAYDWEEISSDSSPNLLQSPLTHAGGVLGTPLYMAPEQHLGLGTDERTDQFGFCIVLYEALYGKRPFKAKTMEALRKQTIREQFRIPQADSQVPGWLWQIIRKGLRAKSESRYPSIDLLLADLDNDPEEIRRQQRLNRSRKLYVIILVLLVTALPIGVWYGLRYRTFQLCKNAQDEFVGVWDNATKTSVQHSFLATNKTYAQDTWERVDRTIARYLAEWMMMRHDVCEARLIRGTQSEDLFDLRMSCLRKRVRELGALGSVFAKADSEVVEKAVQASASLTSIALCDDEEALQAAYPPPQTAEAKTKVTAIRDQLVDVMAFNKTGKYKKGLALARTLVQEANAVDYLPIKAEALYQLGNILHEAGEYEDAATTLYKAAKLAGEIKDALLAAKALGSMAYVVGYHQARHEAGLLLAQDAQILLGVAGKNEYVLAALLSSMGAVYLGQGDYDRALLSHRKCLAIRERILGLEHPEVAKTINNLGVTYYYMGKYDEALVYWGKSMAIQEKTLGSGHPHVALSLNNLGGVLNLKGEHAKALDYHRRALAIREKVLGAEHPDVAMSLNNMGEVFHVQGKYTKALEYHRKALVIWEKVVGKEHPMVARALHYVGSVLYTLGQTADALDYYQKSLMIREKVLGTEHPSLAESLSRIGTAYLDSGRQNQALQPLERVIGLCQKKNCHPGPHGHGLFALARALVATGAGKDRAIKLAKQARDIFVTKPQTFKRNLEGVDVWLQEHGKEQLAKRRRKDTP